jgi:hypothetical protein
MPTHTVTFPHADTAVQLSAHQCTTQSTTSDYTLLMPAFPKSLRQKQLLHSQVPSKSETVAGCQAGQASTAQNSPGLEKSLPVTAQHMFHSQAALGTTAVQQKAAAAMHNSAASTGSCAKNTACRAQATLGPAPA